VNFGRFVRYDRAKLDAWLDTLSETETRDPMGIVEAAGSHELPGNKCPKV